MSGGKKRDGWQAIIAGQKKRCIGEEQGAEHGGGGEEDMEKKGDGNESRYKKMHLVSRSVARR